MKVVYLVSYGGLMLCACSTEEEGHTVVKRLKDQLIIKEKEFNFQGRTYTFEYAKGLEFRMRPLSMVAPRDKGFERLFII